MRKKAKSGLPAVFLAALALVLFAGCAVKARPVLDPSSEQFFQKARLVMTKEEMEIWKRLPDAGSRREFISEFWAVRDPDPSTDENEARQEFERRVDYANTWFGPLRGDRRKLREVGRQKDVGWNTDRGRMYIILGPPDIIYFDSWAIFDGSPEDRWYYDDASTETWVYGEYSLVLQFEKSSAGTWTLQIFDGHLLSSLESAKLNLVARESSGDIRKALKFKANYRDGRLVISIPVSRLSLKDAADKLVARVKVHVSVFRNYKKIDAKEDTREFVGTAEEFSEMKNVTIEIPYELKTKGSYLLDVTVQDLLALAFAKARDILSVKF